MHELSAKDDAVLTKLQAEFGGVSRPEHFTDPAHCAECAEHDATLRSKDVDSIRRADLGQLGWDPITFTTPQGFAYYFPALARVALEHSTSSRDDWYVAVLLSNLSPPGTTFDERLHFLSLSQRSAIAQFLEHLLSSREHELRSHLQFERAQQALEAWCKHAA
jgi:hypothetical protein